MCCPMKGYDTLPSIQSLPVYSGIISANNSPPPNKCLKNGTIIMYSTLSYSSITVSCLKTLLCLCSYLTPPTSLLSRSGTVPECCVLASLTFLAYIIERYEHNRQKKNRHFPVKLLSKTATCMARAMLRYRAYLHFPRLLT